MNTPQHRIPTVFSKFDPSAWASAAGIGLVVLLIFREELLFLLPFVLLLALGVGGYFGWRKYYRTYGLSRLAYEQAVAKNLSPPAPPKSFNWAEHAIYRKSLEQSPQADSVTIPKKIRAEHELIVAASGHGKSQLLEWQILQDLKEPDPPGMLIIDSKTPHRHYDESNLVDRISRLAIFHPDHGRLKDRLIIIDPKDSPSLNVFDTPDKSPNTIADISAQLTYFLGALMESDVSSTMDVLLRPLAHLLIAHPHATLADMALAIDDINAYHDTIQTLPDHMQRTLLTELPSIIDTQTKKAVRRRLVGLTSQAPQFHDMFNAKTNKLDLVAAFNAGKIVLVSTDANELHDASAVFGKFFIARALSAGKLASRRPNYLYIDEALPYTDDKIRTILTTMRSYELGGILAYQTFPDLPVPLQGVIRTNTSIKFIGGNDDDAARIFSRDLRVSPDFIMSQTKDPHIPHRFTRFALNVKTRGTTSFQVDIGLLDKEPRMDNVAYNRLRDANRKALVDDPPQSQPDAAPHVDTNVQEDC